MELCFNETTLIFTFHCSCADTADFWDDRGKQLRQRVYPRMRLWKREKSVKLTLFETPWHYILVLASLFLPALTCGKSILPFPDPTYTPRASSFESGCTAYGFFPSPPQVSAKSLFAHYRALSENAEVVLVQEAIPWTDFAKGVEVEATKIDDMRNARKVAEAHNLKSIYFIDPLNGFNRRQFFGLPEGWQNSFANPDIRTAYKNFALRVLREFRPHYLGLASEINTYIESHPEDKENFLSLYNETYAAIKSEAPQTQVFVTFQWEQLNNLVGDGVLGTPYQIKWEYIEAFEPQLDLWVISSYPFMAFRSAADIPFDYYTPLLTRTEKPLAVGEGGYVSRKTEAFPGTPQDQVNYLTAIHTQIGERLAFWIYLLLSDLDEASYANFFRQQGMKEADIEVLGYFVNIGLQQRDGKTPKPALALWNFYRKESR